MESIRVLYVEDNPADQELTRRHLARHAPHLRLQLADTVGDALAQLQTGEVDLVVSDYRLPDATGLDLLDAVRARDLGVPVVLVTGSGDADAAVRLLKAGAADYVVKRAGYLDSLPAVLDGAFRWFEWVRELRRTTVRVLYAEHDPADIELTRRAFQEHGSNFELEVVSRGREALQQLRAVSYDLFLLDYRMPDLSGIEILKTLREERIRIPVVMLTGQGDEETAVQAFKLGAADYIIKRESYLAKLPSTLENVLAQRRLADEKDALLVLNGLTRSIASLRDVDAVVRQVARAAADLLQATMSVVWLVDEGGLQPAAFVGLDESVARDLRFGADTGLLERTAGRRRLQLADLGLDIARLSQSAAALSDPSRSLTVSLVAAGRLLGVLAVASTRPRVFTGTEERLLTILADHAAIALENVQLYERLSERLEELRRTQAQLIQTEKLAAMGQLLAGVAHELNNPLAVVLGRAALLAEKLGGVPLASQAQKIRVAAERCARIVKNFLALARQRVPEHQVVDLNSVVREAVELLAYQLRVDGVDVHYDLAENLPSLWADPHQLHQVVVNLVSNAHQAMQASAPSSRRLTLATRAGDSGSRVILHVADTGPGISPELQIRIFEPFFTTKPSGHGTGLGLSLCLGIIEAHGGTLTVTSEPGRGATFLVELPVTVPQAANTADRSPASAASVGRRRILVVDDEVEIAGLLADILSEDGHHVETAVNGLQAVERLRGACYDLILCDLRMPELDGPGLYEIVQREQPELRQHFVWLTGDTLGPAASDFLRDTAMPSLSKPFVAEDVRLVIRRVLAGEEP